MVSTQNVVDGIINYIDAEVMGKLPTSGKWIIGTAVGLASNKVTNIIDELQNNKLINMLGVIDESGSVDVDSLISAMKKSADKYGKLTISVPMVGVLSFNSEDIDRLKTYIG